MSLGNYSSFILTSYAIAAAVIAALILWIFLDHRQQQRRLRELELAGATRRSSGSNPTPGRARKTGSKTATGPGRKKAR
jgi:heme exporter protein D